MSSNLSSIKSRATYVWVLTVMVVSIGAFFYLIQDEKSATSAIVPPQFFTDEAEMTEAIRNNLPPEVFGSRHFWIGLEPDKSEQIGVAAALIQKIKLQNPIAKIIVDQELGLKPAELQMLGYTDLIFAKENIYLIGEKLQQLEKQKTGYIFISAAIYTTSLLKKNPIGLLKDQYGIKPVSFSFAYLPVSTEDEKDMVFGCSTDDHSGTAAWGCVVVNRARFARRKYSAGNSKSWFALLDQTEENSFILLLRKK